MSVLSSCGSSMEHCILGLGLADGRDFLGALSQHELRQNRISAVAVARQHVCVRSQLTWAQDSLLSHGFSGSRLAQVAFTHSLRDPAPQNPGTQVMTAPTAGGSHALGCSTGGFTGTFYLAGLKMKARFGQSAL